MHSDRRRTGFRGDVPHIRSDTSPIKIGDDLGYVGDPIRLEGRPGPEGEFWLHGEGGHAAQD